MDHLGSMYIDDELNLEEKVLFMDKIHGEPVFYRDTRELVVQEQLLRVAPATSRIPANPPRLAQSGGWLRSLLKPMVYATAGFTAALLFFFTTGTPKPASYVPNRFVIYEPAARQVALAGSFTGWQPKPMRSIGDSGYWELTLPLPSGEHRFAYILDGTRQTADPTVPRREKDDFGGENSILHVEERV